MGLRHLSTGELLRSEVAAGSELGRRVATTVVSGSLVPDELIVDVVLTRVAEAVGAGYLLDGFPRSSSQAHALLDGPVPPDRVIVLEVAVNELVRRMLARAAIEGRADDTAEIIAHRLAVYRESVLPVVEIFAARGLVTRIDAGRDLDVVAAEITAALETECAGRRVDPRCSPTPTGAADHPTARPGDPSVPHVDGAGTAPESWDRR